MYILQSNIIRKGDLPKKTKTPPPHGLENNDLLLWTPRENSWIRACYWRDRSGCQTPRKIYILYIGDFYSHDDNKRNSSWLNYITEMIIQMINTIIQMIKTSIQDNAWNFKNKLNKALSLKHYFFIRLIEELTRHLQQKTWYFSLLASP